MSRFYKGEPRGFGFVEFVVNRLRFIATLLSVQHGTIDKVALLGSRVTSTQYCVLLFRQFFLFVSVSKHVASSIVKNEIGRKNRGQSIVSVVMSGLQVSLE